MPFTFERHFASGGGGGGTAPQPAVHVADNSQQQIVTKTSSDGDGLSQDSQ